MSEEGTVNDEEMDGNLDSQIKKMRDEYCYYLLSFYFIDL